LDEILKGCGLLSFLGEREFKDVKRLVLMGRRDRKHQFEAYCVKAL